MTTYPIDKTIEALNFIKTHPKMYFQNATEAFVFLQGLSLGCTISGIPDDFTDIESAILVKNKLPNSFPIAFNQMKNQKMTDDEISNKLIDLHIQIWEHYK